MSYLDWNATAPLRPEARQGMERWLGLPANPSSVHGPGRRALQALEQARAQVAGLIGWPAAGVVFTSGASESNATVLAGGGWVGTTVEHPSVRAWLAAELPVWGDGRLRLDELDRWLDEWRSGGGPPGVVGLSVQYANHETGVIQPVEEVLARVAVANRGLVAPLRVHVDAAQAAGKIPLVLGGLVCGAAADWSGPDYITLSAHKLGGPPGVGALLVAPGRAVDPLIRGGAQERGRRAGTPPVYAIVGFGAAAEAAGQAGTAVPKTWFERELTSLGARIVGDSAPRLPTTTSAWFEGVEAADLVMALDMEGYAVSAGAACSSGSVGPSPVLRAMGIEGSAVRYSWGATTTDEELRGAVEATSRVLARVRDGMGRYL